MSADASEWLVIVLFLVSFAGLCLAEAAWIQRVQWASFGKALAFSFGTNLFAFCIGLFTSFVILAIILAMAWDGSINQVPGHDATLWTAMVAAVFITPALLIVIKRLLLWFLKIRSGLPAWIFSLVASILIFVISIGLPAAVIHFL